MVEIALDGAHGHQIHRLGPRLVGAGGGLEALFKVGTGLGWGGGDLGQVEGLGLGEGGPADGGVGGGDALEHRLQVGRGYRL
ncbi:hypothetical protein C8255_19030 [filamentous cyanobacterium CCP3]|nr:hypothetical protein C8255_19030 [filamentous cyanobacterium CCP3]